MICEHNIDTDQALCIDCFDSKEECPHERTMESHSELQCVKCWERFPKPLGIYVKEEIKHKDNLV